MQQDSQYQPSGRHGASGACWALSWALAWLVTGSQDCRSRLTDGHTEPQGAAVKGPGLCYSQVCALPTQAWCGGEFPVTSDRRQPRLKKQVIAPFGIPSSLQFLSFLALPSPGTFPLSGSGVGWGRRRELREDTELGA